VCVWLFCLHPPPAFECRFFVAFGGHTQSHLQVPQDPCVGTGSAMYVTVRFGDSKEEIFNPNCRAVSLLRNIKDRCTFSDEEIDFVGELELSDENGNIKFLRDSPMRYASEILANRECLVLLRVEARSDGNYVSYIPMLRDEEAITEEFMSRLSIREEAESRPDSRRVKSNTRRSPGERNRNEKVKAKGGKDAKDSAKPASRSKSRTGVK